MSVILVTDTWERIRRVVELLDAQSVKERLEVLFLTPEPDTVEVGVAAFDGFAAVRVLRVDSVYPLSVARAIGVRAAAAPLVFIGETHSYPEPGWAEALIEAATSADVVVPAFSNPNPREALSWAAFLADYGIWGQGREPGPLDRWPGYNCACSRSLLLSLGEDLDAAIGRAGEIWNRLPAAHFEPRARMGHLNVSRPREWMDERYLAGLIVGTDRAVGWSVMRRAAYALAAPAIFVVVVWRGLPAVRWARRQGRLPRGTLVAWTFGMLVRVAGEAVAYVFGMSEDARLRMNAYEVRKTSYVVTGP
ncbi:MAG TPA: hypothetical protein VGA70_11720 [Longimicrobiales bacterium]|jgi:hypothetical protein